MRDLQEGVPVHVQVEREEVQVGGRADPGRRELPAAAVADLREEQLTDGAPADAERGKS